MLKHRNFLQKWHAKNAAGNPLRNPLFPHRDAQAKRRGFIGAVVFACAIPVVAALLIYGPWLRITSVQIDGLTSVPVDLVTARVDANISQWKFHLFPKNSIIFFDTDELERDLISAFQLKTAQALFDGRKLIVTVEESVLEVALRSEGKTFFLKLDGTVSREASQEESSALDARLGIAEAPEAISSALQSTMPIVYLATRQEHDVVALSEALVSGVITVDEGLRKRAILPKQHTLARLADNWITTSTEQGFDVMIDVTRDIEQQLETLQTVLREKENATYEYIDVRFGEHVFVKEL